MGVRRVVTGIDDDGRSTFLSDGEAFGGDAWAEVWLTDPELGLDAVVDPQFGTAVLEPPAGGTVFRVFHVPTDAQMREAMREAMSHSTIEGIEADGFHTTQTIDYVMVLEGEISLELDTGEVSLGPGDCVVQRGTRHAWRNRTDGPVKMMAVMVSTREPWAARPGPQGQERRAGG
jgi:mannose-6-phosphate isomerase-like protein (cupin superfamily)